MNDTPETDAFMARLWEQYDQGRFSLENLESRLVSKIRDLERDRNRARDSLKPYVSKTLCLERELAELREDKARLDWLLTHKGVRISVHQTHVSPWVRSIKSVAKIDAAMAEEEYE